MVALASAWLTAGGHSFVMIDDDDDVLDEYLLHRADKFADDSRP